MVGVRLADDGIGGELHLHSYKVQRGVAVWGGRATAEQARTPQGVGRFLVETLYYHVQPLKARRSFDATGAVCSQRELAAFFRGQRRLLLKSQSSVHLREAR